LLPVHGHILPPPQGPSRRTSTGTAAFVRDSMSPQPRHPRQIAPVVHEVDHVRPGAGGDLLGAGGVVGSASLSLSLSWARSGARRRCPRSPTLNQTPRRSITGRGRRSGRSDHGSQFTRSGPKVGGTGHLISKYVQPGSRDEPPPGALCPSGSQEGVCHADAWCPVPAGLVDASVFPPVRDRGAVRSGAGAHTLAGRFPLPPLRPSSPLRPSWSYPVSMDG
jgi:hypothetical protein